MINQFICATSGIFKLSENPKELKLTKQFAKQVGRTKEEWLQFDSVETVVHYLNNKRVYLFVISTFDKLFYATSNGKTLSFLLFDKETGIVKMKEKDGFVRYVHIFKNDEGKYSLEVLGTELDGMHTMVQKIIIDDRNFFSRLISP